jgi:hypothetical protein
MLQIFVFILVLLLAAVHSASYTVGAGVSFPGGKAWPGHAADHLSPSSAKVKKE